MTRVINARGVRICTDYSMNVFLSSWSRHTVQPIRLPENPKPILLGLQQGANLFDLVAEKPASELKRRLIEPMSPDEPGLSPEFYDITCLAFNSVDWLTLRNRNFYAEAQPLGPYFIAEGQRNIAKRLGLSEKALTARGVVYLNPNRLSSEDIHRITSAMERAGG